MVRFLALLFILLPFGAATIDGVPDEWTEDYFLGRMHVPDPEGTEWASLYGMTDCLVMDFAVLADVPASVLMDPTESWIKVGPLTYDDVTYINPANGRADGFEIEIPISAVQFTTTAHINVYDGCEVQTVRSDTLDLRLDCATAAELAWFQCGTDGTIVGCAWETSTEINMSYFYLFRNDTYIATLVPRFLGQPIGSLYAYDDMAPGTGTITYTLEVVNHIGPSDFYTDTITVEPIFKVFFPYVGKDGPHGN